MAGAGFLIASAHVDIAANTRDAIDNISGLITKLVAVGPAAGGAATVVAGALGSVTAGLVSAGAAAGAFGLAVKPQLEAAKTAAGQYAAAQHAAAVGSADAAAKQKQFEETVSKMPPATRGAALALGDLQYTYKQWSDALAGDTMPVLNKSFVMATRILPMLTPLVKTGAEAFNGFFSDLNEGVENGGFKRFIDRINAAAKETLPDLLETFRQIFRGIGGVIDAFLPSAGTATQKMVEMATAFGNWGQNLAGSQGFNNFMTFVSENGPKVAATLGSLAEIAVKLWQAFSPLASIQLTFLMVIADFVSKMPPPVILGIAAALVALKVALLGFRIASMLTGTAMWPLITATWAWTAALLANPITWIVLLIVGLVAAIVLIATKTDWFQRLWRAAWSGIKAAWDFVWGQLQADFRALGNFFTKTIPAYATSLKNKVVNAWNTLLGKIREIDSNIKSAISNAWNSIVSAVTSRVASLVSRVKSGFNTAKSVVTNAGSAIVSRVRSAFTSMVNTAREKVNAAVSAVRGFKDKVTSFFSNAGSWLVSSGRKLIQGFVNGIKSMAGAVGDAVGSVLSKARNLLPFSPAKEGPFSGKGWTEYSGKSLMQGLATGIESGSSLPFQSMSSALQGVSLVQPATANQATTPSGNTYHFTVNVNGGYDLSKPNERRELARTLAKESSEEIRNYEKERR